MIERLKEYYIDNTTSTAQVITLELETSCGVYEPVNYSQTVPALTESKINFPSDGTYKVLVDTVEEGVALYYLNLFNTMIDNIQASLCGNLDTNCVTGAPYTGDTDKYLNSAIGKTIMYASSDVTDYGSTLTDALPKIRCSALTTQAYISKQEEVYGTSSSDELLKIELAHFYMELYAIDILKDDTTAVKELYKYTSIYPCITRLGVYEDAPSCPPPAGIAHTATITVAPTMISLGSSTSVNVLYNFTANDDTFNSVEAGTNVPNVTIAKFNGLNQSEAVIATEDTTFTIEYKYTRGGQITTREVSANVKAYPPQWFGGESGTTDFTQGSEVFVTNLLSEITNVQPVLQDNSNGSSSNTNTTGEYIWWITQKPIKFYIGAFEVPTGPWNASCNPNDYAIIYKVIDTVMQDGTTTVPMYYYRTCALQSLTGQTLNYILKE